MIERERVDDLLRRTTVALIYQCMLPPDGELTNDHLWHCIWLAQDIENLYRARGHWTQAASVALVDMSTARLEAVRALLHPEGQRGDPEKLLRERAARADLLKADWTVDFDLRRTDGTLLRLKRRDGESDEEYGRRRAEQKDGRTRLFDPDDYEVIEQSDWTTEDDRLVLIGRIAEQIESMDLEQLERVLTLAEHIADE